MLVCVLAAAVPPARAQDRDPSAVGAAIIARVMNETRFALTLQEQKAVLDIEVIDFSKSLCGAGVAYAASTVFSPAETTLSFGISYRSPFRLSVGAETVIDRPSAARFHFRESAYGVFEFNDTVSLHVKKGSNPVLIKSAVGTGADVICLRELTKADAAPFAQFSSSAMVPGDAGGPHWLFLGVFEHRSVEEPLPPDNGVSLSYTIDHAVMTWQRPAPSLVLAPAVMPGAAYTRESYAEWNYPDGIMMLAILEFGEQTRQRAMRDFVQRYCDFTLKNLPVSEKQYVEGHALRGWNHRIHRKSMLDDAGAPALPFMQLLKEGNGPAYRRLVGEMAEYVLHGQTMLDDGTLCRIEPEAMTVWADDAFMSVPFLLRYGSYAGSRECVDRAALQIVNTYRYLFDASAGLCAHGYSTAGKARSEVYWSRANGWLAWAASEALMSMPESHPAYGAIQNLFQQHMEGIVRHQSRSGMWHQVLDDPATFEETSSTAMFLTALIRGVRNGWIDRSNSDAIMKAWKGLAGKISEDGVVRDICRGTGIGHTKEFYARRERYPNDPRGLGAVITACREMARYSQGE